MFITKWAQQANVPRYLEDEIVKIPKSQHYSVISSPCQYTFHITASLPEPSRRELMRALRRNERIMHKHEQLLLQLHPGLGILGLEQICSPEVSQNQQERVARSSGMAGAEEDDEFQSAETAVDAGADELDESDGEEDD
ncbi:hypothetical protein PIB30_087455 [Stylosanthes scabra]|uniref:Uncharacterized protein n=1 Tax=Stylosanthes scabra TaxID=79078 RepID=A0ABU6ZS26_9FABA|nr:hypothetical protein [Stylosanthes scabra]